MPRLLTLFVAAYWTTFFAILALAAAGEVAGDGFPILHALVTPDASPFMVSDAALVSSILAIGFLLVAVLFLWTMATVLFGDRQGDGDEVARIALGAGAGMMTVLLALGVGSSIPDVLSAITLQLVALLVSYVAILAEAARQAARAKDTSSRSAGQARFMAIGAAHHTMLARPSRGAPSPTERS